MVHPNLFKIPIKIKYLRACIFRWQDRNINKKRMDIFVYQAI